MEYEQIKKKEEELKEWERLKDEHKWDRNLIMFNLFNSVVGIFPFLCRKSTIDFIVNKLSKFDRKDGFYATSVIAYEICFYIFNAHLLNKKDLKRCVDNYIWAKGEFERIFGDKMNEGNQAGKTYKGICEQLERFQELFKNKDNQFTFLWKIIEFISGHAFFLSFKYKIYFQMFLYNIFWKHLSKRDLEWCVKDYEQIRWSLKECHYDILEDSCDLKEVYEKMGKQIEILNKLLLQKR